MKDVMDQRAVPEPDVSRMAARIMAEFDGLAIPYDYGGVSSGVIGRHGCPVG
jgi:hypothetical protein